MLRNTVLKRAILTQHSAQSQILTALIESNRISIRLCFLQRSIRGSTTESKWVKKVALMLITSMYYIEI